jgi:hypothetical protein
MHAIGCCVKAQTTWLSVPLSDAHCLYSLWYCSVHASVVCFILGVFVTREHVRHNKSGITHRGKTRLYALSMVEDCLQSCDVFNVLWLASLYLNELMIRHDLAAKTGVGVAVRQ